MKAIICTRYGSPDVLQVREVARPEPKDDEVLIRVHAAAVNAGDRLMMRGQPLFLRPVYGLSRPKHPIPGIDVAGEVVAVGRAVEGVRPGDAVMADLTRSGHGGFAEYVCAPARNLVTKPDSLSYEQAATLPTSGVTALQAVRDKGRLQPGQRVLIYGASGGVGTFALQIAVALGAVVTAVVSARNVDMARALGATEVLDYAHDDFTRRGDRYDLIVAVNGYRPLTDYRRALAPGGAYVMAGGTMGQIFQALLLGPVVSAAGGKSMSGLAMTPEPADLATVAALAAAGQVRPVIDRCYPLVEAADAFRYLEREHARGKVIITVGGATHGQQ